MSEYIDWQPDDNPVKVRVHRRVLAGIEQEGSEAFRGVLLGSASPVTREVLVEDFSRLESGTDFRPIEDWFAGWNRHSLPAVGYFRAGTGDEGQITGKDRELFAKYFPDKLNILLLFQLHDGKAQLAPVPAPTGARRVQPGPTTDAPPQERQQRTGDIAAATRVPLREGDLPAGAGELAASTQAFSHERGERPREIGAGTRTPLPDREAPPRLGGPGSEERVGSLSRAGNSTPLDRLSAVGRDRHEESFPGRSRPDAAVDPDSPRRTSRRYLTQIAAVAAGFLLGVVGYLALRGDKPRQIAPAAAPVAATEQPERKAPSARPTPGAPATPVTQASTARPSPFDGSSEANRSVDPGAPSVNRSETQQEIRTVLTRWGETLLEGDVAEHVSLYAPTVSPYFTKKGATRAQIRDDVRQMLGHYGKMTVYKISDISITPIDANNAFATFRKHWETEGSKFSGEEREQLKLTRKGGDWLIASEREVKVFWVKKK